MKGILCTTDNRFVVKDYDEPLYQTLGEDPLCERRGVDRMTVQELINRLMSYPRDLEVIFAGIYDCGYGEIENKNPLFLRHPDRIEIIIDEDGE